MSLRTPNLFEGLLYTVAILLRWDHCLCYCLLASRTSLQSTWRRRTSTAVSRRERVAAAAALGKSLYAASATERWSYLLMHYLASSE